MCIRDSLTTILQHAEDRSALTILIADCTEAMRQNILDSFDPKQTGKKSDTTANLKGDQALLDQELDPGTVNVADKDREKKALERREKELSGAAMQELKAAALKHFDDWRSAVIQRVGEIVNSKETAQQHSQHANPRARHGERSGSPMRYPQPPKYDPNVGEMMTKLYPPTSNVLRKLPEEQRALILHSVLLLLLSLEHYQSYSRTVLLYLTTSLDLSVSFLAQDESKIARGLLTAAANMKADEETKKRAEENQSNSCLLYTSPSPRDRTRSRMPSSA